MVTEAFVSFLLEKLSDFAAKWWNRIDGIEADVDDLKQQMKDIVAVQREAGNREVNEQVKLWLSQVRDLAYDIEDVLDKFDFDVSRLSNLSRKVSSANIIEKIKSKIERVKNSKDTYFHPGLYSSQCHNPDSSSNSFRNAALPDETDVVGIEKPLRDLMDWTKNKEPNLQVMFIVGMGGSGKTLLANQVYKMIKKEFDFCAWIPVSSSQNSRQLLQSMHWELRKSKHGLVPGQSNSTNEYELKDQLLSLLHGRRYLVVFDDLGSKEVWDSIKCALPPKNCGRVIITTRRGDTAHLCCDDRFVSVYNHKLLPSTEAKILFHKKAFPSNGERSVRLLNLSHLFLTKCEGNPLAIATIGNLLSRTEQMEDAWMQLHDSLGSELQTTGRLSSISNVFSTSWNELPHDLKYCLLYLAIFPDDYKLPRRKLIRLWISEGLVRKVEGKTAEQVGEYCLEQLIQRGLVLPNESDFNGQVKFCHVHHLFHKIIRSRAQEENFCQVFTDSNAIQGDKVRRLCVLKSCSSMSRTKFPVARTLFAFELKEELSRSIAEKMFARFSILKVLDLEDAPLDKFPDSIVELVLLRYLSLRNTQIKQLPKTISKLQNLEILDLKHTLVTELPSEVFKLRKLRHLLVYRYNISNYVSISCVQGFKASWKIGRLESLQKISMIKANGDHEMIQELQNLTNLRKLGIIDLKKNDGIYLCNALQNMTNLQSLDVSSSTEAEYLDLPAMQKPPVHLQRLYLKGRLQKLPDFVSTLHDLLRIRLKWSQLSSSPINALQDLHNLTELQLLDAYTGQELVFPAGKFKKLKILELERLGALKTVIIEKGALVSLQTLILRRCGAMEIAPRGIKKLPVLENIHLYDMPEKFLSNICHERYSQHLRIFYLDATGDWIQRDYSPYSTLSMRGIKEYARGTFHRIRRN